MHQHIGYGEFQLQDLLPKESFARFDSTLCRVCPNRNAQSQRIPVRSDVGSLNERTVWLHPTARVHAISQDQAVRIQRRIRRRKRRKEKSS